MKINADVNIKNWLTKMYAIKDLFGIQVNVSVNVINHVTFGKYLDYESCKCKKKKILDKLVEECI